MKTTIAIAVHDLDDSPVFGRSVTEIRLDDAGGGPFVVISQAGNEGTSAIRLDPTEVAEVFAAAQSLLDGVA